MVLRVDVGNQRSTREAVPEGLGSLLGGPTPDLAAPSSGFPQSPAAWQAAMKAAVRTLDMLRDRVGLSEGQTLSKVRNGVDSQDPDARAAAARFPVFVPPFYLQKIERGRADDPLLRQVLPLAGETLQTPDETGDAVGDGPATLTPGVIRKYASRALLITTGACAVHCRYCFRREFPYAERPRGLDQWAAALAPIARDAAINEIILSGGDPWTLADETLAELTVQVATMPHVRRIRVHTRLPVMIPERITEGLIQGLTSTRLRAVVVIHANHPREVCDVVAAAIGPLRRAGVTVLNQAVLLAGVNDSAETLIELSERLDQAGVLPYYLHDLDAVPGSGHFRVPVETGRRLMATLRSRLPGYLVPRYVAEVAGEASKRPLG